MRRTTIAFLSLLWLASDRAEATIWTFDCQVAGTCPNSDNAGKMIASTFVFNDASLDFSWTATFQPKNGRTPDGVWFVIDHGPEPPDTNLGLAIFYGDGDTGRVSAYVYDDNEGKDSWDNPGIFIDTFANAISFTTLANGNVNLSLSLNVASVNQAFPGDPLWQGLFYQNTIGFWAAALNGTDLQFDPDGEILDFGFDRRTSYDRSDRTTTRITTNGASEPATLLLLLAGGAGMWVRRRRSADSLRRPPR